MHISLVVTRGKGDFRFKPIIVKTICFVLHLILHYIHQKCMKKGYAYCDCGQRRNMATIVDPQKVINYLNNILAK